MFDFYEENPLRLISLENLILEGSYTDCNKIK